MVIDELELVVGYPIELSLKERESESKSEKRTVK